MDTRDRNTDPTAQETMLPNPASLSSDPLLADVAQNTSIATQSEQTATPSDQQNQKSVTPLRESLGRFRRDKRAMISLGVIVFFILLAIFGPPIYQHIGGTYQSATSGNIGPTLYHSPFHQELANQDTFINAQNWLGTDTIGRDLLARLMQGILISISVAILVEIVDIALGITIGVLAGYFGGWIDQFLARFTDIMFAFPGLLFVILISGIFGTAADTAFSGIPIIGPNGNARLILVSLALALTTWPLMARYVRGQTLQLKEQQFIEAARTSGSSSFQIIQKHIVPNLLSIVIIASTLNIANTIVAEAGISLLGLGVQSPGSSIGLMISDGTGQIDAHPWEVLLPSLVLAIIVLCFSFLGDGLRDAFDPRSKD